MSEQIQMPTEVSTDTTSTRAFPTYSAHVDSTENFEEGKPSLPLSHYVWILRRHVWKIVAFIAACVLVTFIVSSRLKPVYESSATINIDPLAPSTVVGQASGNSSSTVDTDIFFTTQMRLIQSDAVLRPVAEQFHLLDSSKSKKGSDLEESQSLASAPVFLGHLHVTRPTNTYLLQISYRASDPHLAANIANTIAKSYLDQVYSLHTRSSADLSSFMGQQLDELKAKMERSSQALAKFEKEMDVINPEQKTDILSARLQQLNTEYTTAQSDRISKEAAWNAIKSGSGAGVELSSQSDSLSKLSDALNDAQQHFALVKSTFGIHHPEYRKAVARVAEAQKQFDDAGQVLRDRIEQQYKEAVDREQMLRNAVADAKSQWDQVNAGSFEYQQLKQEADADKALYNELVTKISEAGINADFQSNNIRLADRARPAAKPISPNIKLNLLIAFLFSTLLAGGAAILHDSLDTTLRDPDESRRYLGADVIGMLPRDSQVTEIVRTPDSEESIPESKAVNSGAANGNGRSYRGYYRSISAFEEAVRTIRNTIFLSDFEHRLHSIAVTSAEPGEGKTTLSTHLAIANAARGKSTLLVDGDLRRPSIHARFGLDPRVGLSNVLNGEISWKSVVLPVEGVPNLSLLPSGPGSHRAADLIGPHLSVLLNEFAKQYDLVILDSPPLLGFAECLQMADAADGVVVVSKAASTKRKAVASVVSTLNRIHANLLGVVLNQVTHETSADAYSYYGYKQYKQYSEEE